MQTNFDYRLEHLPEEQRQAAQAALASGSWIAVRRALSAFKSLPPPAQGPEITLSFLSTFNVESILPALELGLRTIPCRPALQLAPLDSIEQQLLNPSSEAYSRKTFANVILWRLEELFPELFFCGSHGQNGELESKIDALSQRLQRLLESYARHGSVPLFISTLPFLSSVSCPVFASQQFPGPYSALCWLNHEIYRLASKPEEVRILDLFAWSAQEGGQFYDPQMDFFARQPFTVKSALSLGLFLSRNVKPLLASRRKVLAVDLDNTLWGGILGEDGVQYLKIGNDFPGNVFLRLQRELLELKSKGTLLVLLSKNSEADVQQAFSSLPDLLLKWEDFACRKINFEHKYLNLRAAASELGLGTDSFAFLDDADYERQQMRAFNPEVLLLNQRSDPVHMLQSLLQTDAFDGHYVSQEDRNRHQDYQLRAARAIEGHQDHLESFLQSLEQRARLEPINEQNLERAVQMLGKTNQFNLTTRRHSHDALRALLAQQGAISLTLRLKDKFGDQGIVGLLLAVPDGPGSLRVDSFLVSCRALGRGVEDLLWSTFLEKASQKAGLRVYGEYIPTARNGLVKDVYAKYGLQLDRQESDSTIYVLAPVKPVPKPNWIQIEQP
jgi:FkbH-like protein